MKISISFDDHVQSLCTGRNYRTKGLLFCKTKMLCLHSWGCDFKNIFKRGWFHSFVLCRAEFLLDTNHTETRDYFIVNCYSSNFLNIIKMEGFSRLKLTQLHTYVTACLIMSFNKSAKFITDYSCYKISVTKKKSPKLISHTKRANGKISSCASNKIFCFNPL